MERVELVNISFGGACNLFHHGVVKDCIEKKDFDFSSGNLYGVIGEFGEGGASLSCGITGNTEFYEGIFYLDGIKKNIKDIVDISWYVGNDMYQNEKKRMLYAKNKINKRTIKEQIEYGISCQKISMDFDTIRELFEISSERVNRNIEFVSGERWKASAAIGFANGKKIFCYPWMNTKDINHFENQLTKTIEVLIKYDCIVIIPTTKMDNIKKISENGHIIYL